MAWISDMANICPSIHTSIRPSIHPSALSANPSARRSLPSPPPAPPLAVLDPGRSSLPPLRHYDAPKRACSPRARREDSAPYLFSTSRLAVVLPTNPGRRNSSHSPPPAMVATAKIPQWQLFIDGDWRAPVLGRHLPIINPTTEASIGPYQIHPSCFLSAFRSPVPLGAHR